MRRVACAVCGTLGLVFAAPLALLAVASAPEVELRDGRLSVEAEKVPLAQVLEKFETATGAEIKGDVREPREVSIRFEAVPLEEALTRLLGEQNYTVVYGEDGRPRRIELLGGPLAKPPPGSGRTDDTSTAELSLPEGWPPDAKTREAVEVLQAFVDRNPSIPLRGRLAQKLGGDTTTFEQLVESIGRLDDPRLRTRAWRTGLRSLQAEPLVWDAFVTMVTSLPDDPVRDWMRTMAGPHAEELMRHLVRHGPAELRTKASGVLDELAAQGSRPQGS